MKIAVIGSGGCEHAVIKLLLRSPGCGQIVAIPGNAGIAHQVTCVPILETDIIRVVAYCVAEEVDYVVVSSTPALVLGLVDALWDEGIPAFGPTWAAARLESSKIFAKNLMTKHHIPTGAFRSFEDAQSAFAYVGGITRWPVLVKPDGIARGRGFYICHNKAEAARAVRELMVDHACGDAGDRILVEEYLEGSQLSVMAFCDGQRVVPLAAAMDLRETRMALGSPYSISNGAIAPHPAYTPALAHRCMSEIFLPTVQALASDTALFTGCLYFGIVLTADGPKVVEYNCRFGDPECAVVLPLLQGDLLELMLACTRGQLSADMVRRAPGTAACLEVTTSGYPGPSFSGLPIMGLDENGGLPGVEVYHHDTRYQNGALVSGGGRVFTLAAAGPDWEEISGRLYGATGQVRFSGARHSPMLADTVRMLGEQDASNTGNE